MIIIRDGKGKTKGEIRRLGTYLMIYDNQGRCKGKYAENEDRTYNRQGQNVGTGNQLVSLLDN